MVCEGCEMQSPPERVVVLGRQICAQACIGIGLEHGALAGVLQRERRAQLPRCPKMGLCLACRLALVLGLLVQCRVGVDVQCS